MLMREKTHIICITLHVACRKEKNISRRFTPGAFSIFVSLGACLVRRKPGVLCSAPALYVRDL